MNEKPKKAAANAQKTVVETVTKNGYLICDGRTEVTVVDYDFYRAVAELLLLLLLIDDGITHQAVLPVRPTGPECEQRKCIDR